MNFPLVRFFCTLLLFSIFSLSGFAQREGHVSGMVYDSLAGVPLPGVSVKVEGGGTASTNLEGKFEIPVNKAGRYKVHCMMVGYKPLTVQIDSGDFKDIFMYESITQFESVVISAGKFEQKMEELTVSVEILKPDLIEQKNTNNMESVIDQVPGISMMEGQCNIRGGSGFSYGAGSRVLLLVDELPMLSADAGDVKWNFLPVENISQVEVIKGASSALYGSSALNGVINVRTAYPTPVPKTELSFSSGFYNDPLRDTLNWWGKNNPVFSHFNFFHSRQLGQLDLVVAGQLFSDEGFRMLEKEQRYRGNANLRWRSKKVKGLSYGINFNRMVTEGGLFILWQNADSAYIPQNYEVQIYSNTRTSLDPFLTYYTDKDARHSLRGRFYQTQNENNTSQSSLADLYYGEYQFQKRLKKDLTLTAGFTAVFSEVNSDSMYKHHTSNNYSLYAQADKKWKRFVFSLGIRGEFFRVDTAQTEFHIPAGQDTITLPVNPVARMGVSYKAAEHTFLRGSFGQGYRFPSVAEKFVSTTANSLKTFPNPGLQPEHGWSAEIGVKQGIKIKKWAGYLDVAGFWTEYRDMMEFNMDYYIPESITNPTLTDYINYFGAKSVNVGHTRITGAEVTLTGTGKLWKDLHMTVLGGYTYINPVNLNNDSAYTATFSDSGSSKLKYRWEHVAKLDVQLEWKKYSLGFSLRYNSFMKNIDRRFEDRLLYDVIPALELYILPGLKQYREEHKKGDLVMDIRAGWEMSKTVKMNVVINNVFNREYMSRPGDMMPPRNSSLQLLVRF
ncbi:MAG: TonB-dependent receptor [Bacteroidia bacterium]|nr:TonB-dependent receptor [Bacteroidia bacterium]